MKARLSLLFYFLITLGLLASAELMSVLAYESDAAGETTWGLTSYQHSKQVFPTAPNQMAVSEGSLMAQSSANWNIETVTSDARHISLALDTSGYAHISFYDSASKTLKYTTWTGSQWAIQTVDSSGDTGWYTSIALDSSGYPHISYYDNVDGRVKYAAWNGTTWQIQTVEADVGKASWYPDAGTSLVLDAVDHPHISYYDGPDGDLKYATWNGSTWDIQTVDSAGSVGGEPSLALDSAGYPHIAYEQHNPYNLKYARWTGSFWSIQTVDSSGKVGGSISLDLDSAGRPHISYSYGYPNYGVMYAAWDGMDWRIEAVDPNGMGDTSLTLDNADQPYIAYRAVQLTYAFLSETQWVKEIVDSAIPSGEYASLSLSPGDYPHISYSALAENLRYTWITRPAQAIVPPTGGKLDKAGAVCVEIPNGAITDTIVLTYTPQAPQLVGGSLVGIGYYFDLTAIYSSTGQPAQLAPSQTYTVTVQYTDAEKGPVIEDTLALYWWDSSQWVKEPSSVVDTAANTVTATPNHFSLWAVLGETQRVFLPVILRNY